MIRWNNDYNRGAHPAILDALAATNAESYGGYGEDEWCSRAAAEIKRQLGAPDADVHFMTGGTQVNFTVIASALRPYQSVISADSGHINCHETGAVENTGHKIQAVPGTDGKLTAEAVEREARNYSESPIREHVTQPKLVYLSFPTEYGTLYSKKELEDISRVCRKYGLYMFIDGARLGYALGSVSCDVTLRDIAELTDVFYIGGTKCGALFGEAVVILNDSLKPDFRSYMKQNGGMLAKGWLLGLQFHTLFADGLYFDITKRAVSHALEIKAAFVKKGIPLYIDSPTNQQFVVLTRGQLDRLGRGHTFEEWSELPDGRFCVRFCISWSTTREDVDALIGDISAL